eukprot:6185564-Pleurochrysis_carterae.AAC.4
MSQRQASTVWAKRPAGRLPTAERQQALVSWMQAHVLDGAEEPARLTFLTLSGAPRLLLRAGRRFPELQRSFEAVRAALGALSPKQLAYSVAHSPVRRLLTDGRRRPQSLAAPTEACPPSGRPLDRVCAAQPGPALPRMLMIESVHLAS